MLSPSSPASDLFPAGDVVPSAKVNQLGSPFSSPEVAGGAMLSSRPRTHRSNRPCSRAALLAALLLPILVSAATGQGSGGSPRISPTADFGRGEPPMAPLASLLLILLGAATERAAGRRRWQGSPCEGSGRRLARLDMHSTAVSGFFKTYGQTDELFDIRKKTAGFF
jgi:hypothetical protein